MNKKIQIIQETGYGVISQAIMRDSSLSIQAKAIYSYLSSFAGNKSEAYPSVELITVELGLSNNTYYKYLKELVVNNLIEIKKERNEKGQYLKNIYYLKPSIKKPYMAN